MKIPGAQTGKRPTDSCQLLGPGKPLVSGPALNAVTLETARERAADGHFGKWTGRCRLTVVANDSALRRETAHVVVVHTYLHEVSRHGAHAPPADHLSVGGD